MKALHLTLHKEAFEVMVTGEKTKEFRSPKMWMMSRLVDRKTGCKKHYDVVHFRNGYNDNAPMFSACYDGFEIAKVHETYEYSNGLIVSVEPGDIIIKLTPII